jgi:hypothetical protein
MVYAKYSAECGNCVVASRASIVSVEMGGKLREKANEPNLAPDSDSWNLGNPVHRSLCCTNATA